MKKIEFTKKLKLNEDNTYFEESGKVGILTKDIPNENLLKLSFENFTISDDKIKDKNGVNFIKVYISDQMALSTINYQLNNNSEYSFWELLMILDKSFSRKQVDMKKFRGDLAEVIFLLVNGGEKRHESDSADIYLNGDIVEVKSFSHNKRVVTISKQQLTDEVLIYAVGIKLDNQDGKNIIEMSKKIVGNTEFKEYLEKEYSNTYIGEYSKYSYKLSDIMDITEFVKNLGLNDFVVEAKVRLI